MPLNDAIDIGVLDADGQALYLAKHRLTQPETELTITVDARPVKAGIDVYHKLIDRDSEDNLVKVEFPNGKPAPHNADSANHNQDEARASLIPRDRNYERLLAGAAGRNRRD